MSRDQPSLPSLLLVVLCILLTILSYTVFLPLLGDKRTPILLGVLFLLLVNAVFSKIRTKRAKSTATSPDVGTKRRTAIRIAAAVLILGVVIALPGATLTTGDTRTVFRLVLGVAGLVAWLAGMVLLKSSAPRPR